MTKVATEGDEVPTTSFGIGELFSGAVQGSTLQSGAESDDCGLGSIYRCGPTGLCASESCDGGGAATMMPTRSA